MLAVPPGSSQQLAAVRVTSKGMKQKRLNVNEEILEFFSATMLSVTNETK